MPLNNFCPCFLRSPHSLFPLSCEALHSVIQQLRRCPSLQPTLLFLPSALKLMHMLKSRLNPSDSFFSLLFLKMCCRQCPAMWEMEWRELVYQAASASQILSPLPCGMLLRPSLFSVCDRLCCSFTAFIFLAILLLCISQLNNTKLFLFHAHSVSSSGISVFCEGQHKWI